MRRGLAAVLGDTGESIASDMASGTVIVFGALGANAGRGNRRGSIVVFGRALEIPSGYRFCCFYTPVFLGCFLAKLREWGVAAPLGLEKERFVRHMGDSNTLGKGEILVRNPSQ